LPTIAEAIAEGASLLNRAPVPEQRRTATVLLGAVLGVDRTYLLTRSDERVGDDQFKEYMSMVERRGAGEPLQYITGHQEFYGLDFLVTPAVLIPRPETEFLVEAALKIIRAAGLESPLIADAGTGSGCIAIALAREIRQARVIAIDISRAALDVARRNAERLGVADRIEFLEGDFLDPLARAGLAGKLDLIASNPPYVSRDRPGTIQREVRDWEPHVALFGGKDGLDYYRRLIAESSRYLKPGGWIVCEIGYSQLDQVREIIDPDKLMLHFVAEDLQGIPRTLAIQRKL
jgi:release factor glutamine methyltransferase